MASEQIVYHIDEQFCQCAICLKPFSEPKSLPCLHRFCKECLSPLFVTLNAGDIFYCPLCRAEMTVTEGSVEDIKSDFLVSELTKVIQLQKTLKSQNQIRRCEGCNKEEESVGFCSRCGGFLCQNCFSLHQTLKTAMLKDHQPVIDLKDVFAGKVKIGLEKLSQFTKAPRCQNHPENILRLSCVTCEGQQICIACTYEDHVEHKAESIRNMAGKQRDDLQKKLDEMRLMVTNWEKNSEKLTATKEKLSSAVEKVTRRVKRITEDKLEKLKVEQETLTLSTETKVSEIEKRSALEKSRLENEKNEKLKEIERQYEELLKKHNIDMNNNIEKVKEDRNKRSDQIEKQITHLKAHCDEMINAVSKQVHNQNLGLDGLMSNLSNIQKRFENFITTGASIVSLANDWSAVESIPSLCVAFEVLKNSIEETNTKVCEFEDESNFRIPTVNESQNPQEVGFIDRHKYMESVTDVSHIPFRNVDKIVFLKSSDCIVMSGNLTDDYSSAVIKTNVTGSEREYLKRFTKCSRLEPYCLICQVDEDTIATACENVLGIINVKESMYNEVKVQGIENIGSICADRTVKQLFTCRYEDDTVKVFDLDLNLVKTRNLPFALTVTCTVVHDDQLIIGCRMKEEDDKIYVLNKDDEIMSVILPPGVQRIEGTLWNCRDVCCSEEGTLFAVWRRYFTGTWNTPEKFEYIVQYTPKYYPLEIIKTNTGASRIAVMEKDGKKTVVAAAGKTLYMYKCCL